MILNTKGIVIKKNKYSDSSLIVKIFTLELGITTFFVPSAFSNTTKTKIALFQPLNLLNLIIYYQQNRNMHRIKEVNCYHFLNDIHQNILKTSIGIFMTEISGKCIHESEKDENLYQFLEKSIISLDTAQNSLANFPLIYLVKFSEVLGFAPASNHSSDHPYFNISEGQYESNFQTDDQNLMDETQSFYLNLLYNTDIAEFASIKIKKSIRQILLRKMLNYFHFHVSGFKQLNSLAILEEVLK